jgi:hypothetical protein
MLEILIPSFLNACLKGLTQKSGDYCVIDRPKIGVIKYYEPGKSCYKNGVFYEKCENSPEVRY